MLYCQGSKITHIPCILECAQVHAYPWTHTCWYFSKKIEKAYIILVREWMSFFNFHNTSLVLKHWKGILKPTCVTKVGFRALPRDEHLISLRKKSAILYCPSNRGITFLVNKKWKLLSASKSCKGYKSSLIHPEACSLFPGISVLHEEGMRKWNNLKRDWATKLETRSWNKKYHRDHVQWPYKNTSIQLNYTKN